MGARAGAPVSDRTGCTLCARGFATVATTGGGPLLDHTDETGDVFPCTATWVIVHRNGPATLALFWKPGGKGYTNDLRRAGVWTEERARIEASSRPEQDYPVSVKRAMDAASTAVLVTCDSLQLDAPEPARARVLAGGVGRHARPYPLTEANDPETRRLPCCGRKHGWCVCYPS